MTTGNPKANEDEAKATNLIASTIEGLCMDSIRVIVGSGRLSAGLARQCVASALMFVACKIGAPSSEEGKIGAQMLYDAMSDKFNQTVDELRGSHERN